MKKQLLYFAILSFFLVRVTSAQNIFLQGKYVEIGVHPAGSFGSSTAAPSHYHGNASGGKIGFICDIQKDGWNSGVPKLMGDYFVPGTPEEGWGLQWFDNHATTSKTNFFNFGLMNEHEVTTISHRKIKTNGREQSIWIGNASRSRRSALVYQTVTLDSLAQYFTIDILIKNTGSDTLYNLGYFRNVDPDNEQLINGRYETYNYIQHQPGWRGNTHKAAVVAYGAKYKSPCILGAIDRRAHVSIGGFSVRDIQEVFSYKDTTQTQSNPHHQDEAISIAFNLGSLAPGKCVTFSYYYALQDIKPEDIVFPVNTEIDISDDGFITHQSFLGGNFCARDTVLKFAVKTNGIGTSFIDKVLWDSDLDGIFELEGDTIEIAFKGWKKHRFSQRIIFCDGTQKDSVYSIFIEPKPIVKLKANSQDPCFNRHKFMFQNNSYWIKDSIQKFTWKFEGGKDFVGRIPSGYRFDSFSNRKWIRLMAETTMGCKDSNQISVSLSPSPTVELNLPDSMQCLSGNTFAATLRAAISEGVLKPQIIWPSGKMDTTWNAEFVSDSHGIFSVIARVVSEKGCTAIDTHELVVLEQPVADFEINDSSQCFRHHKFKFTNQSYLSEGKWTGEWESINGFVNTLDFETRFQRTGREWIKLKITSTGGCTDSITKWVHIQAEPKALIENPTQSQCLIDNRFVWSSLSEGVNQGRTIWNIPQLAVIDTSNSQEWGYSFEEAGLYKVLLTAENEVGCYDTTSVVVHVHPHPIAKFLAASRVCMGKEFSLLNESDTMGVNTHYTWYFNENKSEALRATPLMMSTTETLNVRLNARNIYGCTHDTSMKIEVMPKSFAEIHTNFVKACANDNVYELETVSKDSSISIIQNSWKWDDGLETEGIRVRRWGLSSGMHSVRVFTENDRGCKDTLFAQVNVLPALTLKAISNAVCYPNPNSFRAESIAPEDEIIKEIWQVAGQEFYGSEVQRFLRVPGTYDVIYRAETAKGCKDTLRINGAAILHAKPKASFELDSFFSDGMGMSLTLKNTSSKDVDQWGWSFNDWEYSADEHPTFLFTDTGLVDMTLIVGNSAGCYDTTLRQMGPYFPIFYLHVPNAFTPNGDDLNQNFKPIINPYLMKYNLQIYNRWGELLFTTDDPTESWDGTFMEKPVQEGVYVYILYATDLMGNFHKDKGVVALMRKH